MQNKWYWAFKHIFFGPVLQRYNRVEVSGLEHIPASGPAILASNHQAVMDSFYLPLVCPRQITFLAKKEYFTGIGLVGRAQRWFFTTVGQVPIDRTSADAGEDAMNSALRVLARGDLFGIYPEGTRSPDGKLYKGKTGMARIALRSGAPVVPVAMLGTREANPIGTWVPRPAKVRVNIGEAIDPRAFVNARGLDPDSYEAARVLTDEVMERLRQLSGQEYVDKYGADVKTPHPPPPRCG